MVGRPKNDEPTKKVEPRLHPKADAQTPAEIGAYGSNATEVAKFLILRELDDLIRAGVLRTRD